jgi:hypothetical protein
MKRLAPLVVALALVGCSGQGGGGNHTPLQHPPGGGYGPVVEVSEPSPMWLLLIGGLVILWRRR